MGTQGRRCSIPPPRLLDLYAQQHLLLMVEFPFDTAVFAVVRDRSAGGPSWLDSRTVCTFICTLAQLAGTYQPTQSLGRPLDRVFQRLQLGNWSPDNPPHSHIEPPPFGRDEPSTFDEGLRQAEGRVFVPDGAGSVGADFSYSDGVFRPAGQEPVEEPVGRRRVPAWVIDVFFDLRHPPSLTESLKEAVRHCRRLLVCLPPLRIAPTE